jgi:nucleoside-diphosphate-sugar epimerase
LQRGVSTVPLLPRSRTLWPSALLRSRSASPPARNRLSPSARVNAKPLERSLARLQVEKSWAAIGKENDKKVYILRLAGIYGPGRNALLNLKDGTAKRVVKRGQVFNRVHVEDIARAIGATLAYKGPGGVFNVSDDAPAPPQDVITYAAMLMGIEPPPEQDVEAAGLSPLARSFYGENKRASNRKLKDELGVKLAFPTYRVGLEALWEAGEGR